MKKSLSVLVATAMVSSMFASVAFAAELTTQEKLDALIAAGIFDKDGTGQGSELEAKMSREQLAKIVALLKKLEVQSGTSYTDVAADRWSAGFIQAVSKVKPMIMDGVADGVFDPSGDVTLEQLATVAVRALGLTVKTDAEVKGEVSDWAKGYVATAVANGLLPDAANTDFTKPAIRAQLVEATYAAKEVLDELVKPAKVSVKEAKAAGVQTVEVKLDRDVDTAKATFALKKGSTTITLDTTATKWSEDKKTVTLKLKDQKLSAGDYTVTLGGVEADSIATASASFKAENETVSKIDFVTSSDEIAKAPKVTLKIKPTNQYGEVATFPAGSYSYFISGNNLNPNLTKDDEGYLKLTLDTSAQTTGIGVVPITFYHNDTRVTVNKTFKVGTDAYVAKIELADPVYSNDKKALTNKDDKASIKLTMYDQYGGIFTKDSIYSNNSNKPTFQSLIAPYEPKFGTPAPDANLEKIEVQLTDNVEKAGEYTLTVYGGTSTATTKINIESTKVANKVEFQDFNATLAAGDVNKYLVIDAYDAAGNKLSADDIVSNAENDRFSISVNGASLAGTASDIVTSKTGKVTGIVKYGEHKGKLKLASIDAPAKGIVYGNVGIYTVNIQNNDTISIPISDARVPSSFVLNGTDAAKKAVLGGQSKFKFEIKDQYGEKLDSVAAGQTDSEGTLLTSRYQVTVTANVYDKDGNLTTATGNVGVQDTAHPMPSPTNPAVGQTKAVYDTTKFVSFNKGFAFNTTSGAIGKIEFKAVLEDLKSGTPKEVTSFNRTIEVVDPFKESLTYSVKAIADVFAYLDNANVVDADKITTSANTAGNPYGSTMAKTIEITAKDGAGNAVAIPATLVQGATSSNQSVVYAVYNGTDSKAKVVGNKAGTATITVAFTTAKGESQVQTVDVTSKADALVVASMTADATKAFATPATKEAWTIMNLKAKDNYGIEYSAANLNKYKAFLGILYTVSDVKLKVPSTTTSSNDVVTVDQTTGIVTVGSNVAEFMLKATSNNGVSKSTIVTN